MKHIELFEQFKKPDNENCYQTVMRLAAVEQAAIKKLLPDARFEWDDDDREEPRQLVFSVAPLDKIQEVVMKCQIKPQRKK